MSTPLLWMLRLPTIVVRPESLVSLVIDPLLAIETLPPTHCRALEPTVRSVSAVLLTLRLPLMHVVPAAHEGGDAHCRGVGDVHVART